MSDATVPSFEIAGRPVGGGAAPLVIAEVAQAHDGSLGSAHAFVDAVARSGADAIKFQVHIAAEESTLREPWRVRFSRQDATRFDYWKRMEFSEEQWAGLAAHAREAKLIFLASPFSLAACELLERLAVPAWKIGSGEVGNTPMLEWVAKTGKPVLLSSGLSSWRELDSAVELLRRHSSPFAVFQCTTAYPCPPEKVGLNVLAELAARYECPVGLSDHSATTFAGLGAVALGADLLEVHVAFSREAFGPDTSSSLTPAELAELVAGASFLHRERSSPVEKDRSASELADLGRIFGKSLVAARDLAVGHLLAEGDLGLKKPGTGLPPARRDELVGRRLRRALLADEAISEEDVE